MASSLLALLDDIAEFHRQRLDGSRNFGADAKSSPDDLDENETVV